MIQPASLSLLPSVNPQDSAVSTASPEVAFEALLLAGVAAGALVEADGGKAIPQSGKILPGLPELPELPVEGDLSALPVELEEPEAVAVRPDPPVRMLPVGDALKLAANKLAEPPAVRLRPAPAQAPVVEAAFVPEAVEAVEAEAIEPAAPDVAGHVPQARLVAAPRNVGRMPVTALPVVSDAVAMPAVELAAADAEAPQPAIDPAGAELAPELSADPLPPAIALPVRPAPAAAQAPSPEQQAPSEPRPIRHVAVRDRTPVTRMPAPANDREPDMAEDPVSEIAQPAPAQLSLGETDEAPEAVPALLPLPAGDPTVADPAPTELVVAEAFAATVEVSDMPVPVATPLPRMPVAESAAPAETPVAPLRKPIGVRKSERPLAEPEATPVPPRAHAVSAAKLAAASDVAAPVPAVEPDRRADGADVAEPLATRRSPSPPRPTATPRVAAQLTIEIDLPAGKSVIERVAAVRPDPANPPQLAARPLRAIELPARVAEPQLPATAVAQAPVAPQAADTPPAKPAIPNELPPSPGQEKRAAVGPGQPELQGARSFTAPSLPLPPLHSQAVAPANLSVPAGDAPVVQSMPMPATQPAIAPLPRAHDVSALVDRLVEAREAARGETLHMAVHNKDFGQVSLRFTQDGGGLTVAVANDDPDFARAIRSAIPAGEARDANASGQGDRRDFAGSQGGRAQADSPGTGGEDAGRRGRSEDTASQSRARAGAHPDSPFQEDATTTAMGGILA